MQKGRSLVGNAQAKGPAKFKGDILPSEKPALSQKRQERLNDALLKAAADGNDAEIRLLIKAGADISAKDSIGVTALHHAALKGHTRTCALLIHEHAKANGNVKELITAKECDGWSALHHAAIHGQTEACRLLITEYVKAGGDIYGLINAKDDSDQTASDFAALNNHARTVQFFVAVNLLGLGAFNAFAESFAECVAG